MLDVPAPVLVHSGCQDKPKPPGVGGWKAPGVEEAVKPPGLALPKQL